MIQLSPITTPLHPEQEMPVCRSESSMRLRAMIPAGCVPPASAKVRDMPLTPAAPAPLPQTPDGQSASASQATERFVSQNCGPFATM